MILLGSGTLPGLKARGAHKLERDPILRNQRIRAESQRAHMRALLSLPPAKFPPGFLGRIALFHVELTRVAPATQQLVEQHLAASLDPVLAGIALHLGDVGRCRVTYLQRVGPWAAEFRVFEDGEAASLAAISGESALSTTGDS